MFRAALPLAVWALSASLLAGDPIFIPFKLDGPVHDPAKGSFWYGPFSEGSAVFDVNGDGHLDITCGANWYEGPKFIKHESFRDHATAHGEFVNNCGEYPVDVNGDGRLDLISAGWMQNGVWWYENPGKAGERWKATKIVSSDQTEGLVVEDIDGDGDSDVLLNHWGPKEGQGVTWLELERGGTFKVHVLGKQGDHHGIGLGDLDGDGRKDVITPRGWYRAPEDRAGQWSFHEDWKLDELGIRMLVLDVNGDGGSDIIYGRGHNYGLGWIEQQRGPDGKAAFKVHADAIDLRPGQFHTLVLADVDQDGKPDLVTGKRLRGHAGADPSSFEPLGVFWYEIQGGTFVKHVLSFNHVPWYDGADARAQAPNFAIGTGMNINVADINKDGKVDIVVSGKSGLYAFINYGLPPIPKRPPVFP